MVEFHGIGIGPALFYVGITPVHHISEVVRAHRDAPGATQFGTSPLANILAPWIKDLDTRIPAIRNIDKTLPVDRDAVWTIEFTGRRALLSPLKLKFARFRE